MESRIERKKLKKEGVKLAPSEEELKRLVKAQREKKMDEYNKILESLKERS